jgi:acyl-coenzyme A synthetase/AMP-(fatty) acid ligase
MLKVGGIYVSPFEVEGALQSHPDVLEAAVVAWPDEQQLIKPKAFVVLKAPDTACEALARALQEHCKAKLAPYKFPRWIEFRADLPKTATGKIQRFKLRAESGVKCRSMKTNPLGRTGLAISEIAFGGGVTGGILITADEATRQAALARAVAGGIN